MNNIPFAMERGKFIFFFHHYCPLSMNNIKNFESRGLVFSSMIHYIAAAKAVLAKNETLKEEILKEADLDKVKSLSSSLRVPEWGQRFLPILKAGIKSKLSQNPEIWKALAETKGKTIVFASEEDKFLGAGVKAFDENCFNTEAWSGKNNLGNIIMDIRDS